MSINKHKILAIFSSAAIAATFACRDTGLFFSPVRASAVSVYGEQSQNAQAGGYSFLMKGNPDSTRERIAAQYDPLFLKLYDRIISELTDHTANDTGDNVESFMVEFPLREYDMTVSDDPDVQDPIISKICEFAQNVMEDSPQFYWTDSLNSVSMRTWMTSNGGGGYKYDSVELYFIVDPAFKTAQARAAANESIENAINGFKSVIAGKDTVYGKLRAVNDKLVMDTYYDINSSGSGNSAHSQNAYGCLINHRCVCNGYAKAFELISNTLGITDTIRITGFLQDAFRNSSVSHAWNACLVGGKWYFVDVTANDPLKNTNGTPDSEYNNPDRYDNYFLIGSTKLKGDHEITANAVPYPVFETDGFTEPTLGTITISGVKYCTVSSADDLEKFAGMVDYYSESPNAILTADIDLSGTEFPGIGNKDHVFNGIFDGAGHKIKGLTVNNGSASAGLFGAVDKAVIKDLTLTSGTVTGSTSDEGKACGALAGIVTTDTVIKNCNNNGVSVNAASAGGLVGVIMAGSGTSAGSIENCTNSAAVNGTKYSGGLAGIVDSDKTAVFKNCIVKGNVNGEKAGSFIGKTVSSVRLNSSLSTVALEVAGEKGTADITADKVCIVGFASSVTGVAYANDTIDGAAAYALGWGQVIGTDTMPDPSKVSADSKVYRLEYTIENRRYAVYFNKAFKSTMIPVQTLPEGYVWMYKGNITEISELEGLTEDISITSQKLDAYISDRVFMTLGESMSYCWLVGADDDIIQAARNDNCPVSFKAKVNGTQVPVRMNGIRNDNGKKYIELSIDLPVKNLSDKISCEISYTSSGKKLTLEAADRSAADYLRKLAADSGLADNVRTAAVSILNYSAAVQKYKGYNDDSLSNDGLAPALKEVAPVSRTDVAAEDAVISVSSDDISLRAITVNMLNKISLRAYYKLSSGAFSAYQNDALTFEFTAPDGVNGSMPVGLSKESTGICGREGEFVWVELPGGISPKDYANKAVLSLNNGSDKGDSARYSVLNYIAGKCETTRGMEKVAAALYRYYEAIKALG